MTFLELEIISGMKGLKVKTRTVMMTTFETEENTKVKALLVFIYLQCTTSISLYGLQASAM